MPASRPSIQHKAGRRVLVVKITSLGDIVHTLPALTDAMTADPGIRFDWVVDRSFSEIPTWHPAVDRTVVIPFRDWQKAWWRPVVHGEFLHFLRDLQDRPYDLIIDAQGQLGKTIWINHLALGPTAGMDWKSAREPLASLHYQHRYHVPKGQHAVERVRQLFAHALGYPQPRVPGNYGIDREKRFQVQINPRLLVFLHGTSWRTKLWPESYWAELIQEAGRHGYQVLLTWGNDAEKQRAVSLANTPGANHVIVRSKSTLAEFAHDLASAAGVVAVDTGLCHLAAALSIPTVSVYGPTSTGLTGAYGPGQHYLEADFSCAPCLQKKCTFRGPARVEPACFEEITPLRVWSKLMAILPKD